MANAKLNGSVKLLADAMRTVFMEAVQEANKPLRKDINGLRKDVAEVKTGLAEVRGELAYARNEGQLNR